MGWIYALDNSIDTNPTSRIRSLPLQTIASTGHLRFHDAADSVRREAARLRDQQNVRIIIVLSHCGIAADYEIARTAGPDVDVIVGGHTHTLMYGGAGPVPNGERARDVYPAVVRQPESGRRVLIVQAAAFSRWVGDLRVWFDADGEVAEWSGNPVFVGETVERGERGGEHNKTKCFSTILSRPDPEVVAMLGPWREIVRQEGAQLLGFATSTMERNDCFLRECLLGNLLADASVAAFSGSGRLRPTEEPVHICLVHVGATRNTLHEGSEYIFIIMLFSATISYRLPTRPHPRRPLRSVPLREHHGLAAADRPALALCARARRQPVAQRH